MFEVPQRGKKDVRDRSEAFSDLLYNLRGGMLNSFFIFVYANNREWQYTNPACGSKLHLASATASKARNSVTLAKIDVGHTLTQNLDR